MAAGELRPEDPGTIGDYRLVGRVGEGGQGVVYLGESAAGERVAVKALRREFLSDGDARRRFVRELEAARQVAPFCTARILEADVDGPQPFIVSEYVDGLSLDGTVRESGPLSGPALDRLAIGTLTALTAIHQAGIVHRDFKPGNVLLGPDGPRVIDFGIARALDGTMATASGIIGTPAYMAPEQLAGTLVGPPTDMFAWASTMAFAATGRAPFGQDTIPAIINRVINQPPDLAGLPQELRPHLEACLAKEAARRPSARDVLLRLLGHAEAPAEPSTMLMEGTRVAAAPPPLPPMPAPVPAPAPPPRYLPPPPPNTMPPPQPRTLPPQPSPQQHHIHYRPPPGRQKNGIPGCAVLLLVVMAAVFGAIVAVSAMTEEETGSPETSRSSQASSDARIPKAFAGTWSGTVYQGSQTYPVKVVLRAGKESGTVSYSTLACSGTWTVREVVSSTVLELTERVDGGTCVSQGKVRLTRRGDRLRFEWRYLGGSLSGDPEARADLRKK